MKKTPTYSILFRVFTAALAITCVTPSWAAFISISFDTVALGITPGSTRSPPPGDIVAGTQVSFQMTYDTDAIPDPTATGSYYKQYDFTNSAAQFSVSANDLTWSSGENVAVTIADDHFTARATCLDTSCFSAFPGSDGGSTMEFSIQFVSDPFSATQHAVPTSASQFPTGEASFVNGNVYGVSGSSSGWAIHAQGSASSLEIADQPVEPIPFHTTSSS